jgi:hypothetical protein
MGRYSEEIDGETRPVTSEYIFSARRLAARPNGPPRAGHQQTKAGFERRPVFVGEVVLM